MARSKFSASEQPGVRLLRVGENIRHAISAILSRGNIQDDDLSGVSVSVSEVRVSPDLRHASVYVIPLGGDNEGQITEALNRHTGFIRGEMSRLVTMKYMPRLKFLLDHSFDEAGHIEQLLKNPRVARDLEEGASESSDPDDPDQNGKDRSFET